MNGFDCLCRIRLYLIVFARAKLKFGIGEIGKWQEPFFEKVWADWEREKYRS